VIFEGTSERTLELGVGHLTASSRPETAGNVVLAAHRDTFFRPLRDVHQGDAITVTTPRGERTYQVRSTEVVQPTDVSVIRPTAHDTLTLITCYPFNFVGAAPERFIVHAEPVN
jgi:sortase A